MIFIRPATPEDSENFTKWFINTQSFRSDILSYIQTYTLCAFKSNKIIGFMVVQAGPEYQILYRFVPNPEASELEKALGSAELLKQVITFGFINNIPEIYFMGDNPGTNRIAQHVFTEVKNTIFEPSEYPVYRLRLEDLCLVQ